MGDGGEWARLMAEKKERQDRFRAGITERYYGAEACGASRLFGPGRCNRKAGHDGEHACLGLGLQILEQWHEGGF